MHQPFFNELHIRTGLAESYLTLTSDDVALPRTAVHGGVGHIPSLKPETGLGFQNLTNHHEESRYTSQFLAVEKPTHETDQQRRRTQWRSVRRLFPNRRPQQMAFCSAVAQQRFCSAFCWAAACSDVADSRRLRVRPRSVPTWPRLGRSLPFKSPRLTLLPPATGRRGGRSRGRGSGRRRARGRGSGRGGSAGMRPWRWRCVSVSDMSVGVDVSRTASMYDVVCV